ncbi:MAG: endonuclease [Chloroflexi bacterium]|nr:endonuclease [Chloroflexota bacterium]
MRVLERMVAAVLAEESNPTGDFIRKTISGIRKSPLASNIGDEAAEQLARRFEERVSITQHLGSTLTDREYRPWLDAAKSGIDPYYWGRYKEFLTQQDFPPNVVSALDSVTDRILGLLQDPSIEGPWDRRGMVVGHVQSGKTANYTGLICKAADAGYKLIVVIAGIHNNLRSQTQMRIDEGFVGRDSARLLSNREDKFVGVGRFDQSRLPSTFTNSLRDFNKQLATGVGIPLQNLREPAVFVIKKNSGTLKNLIEWLREHSARGGARRIDEAMLLIDDEADNASINIKHGSSEVSRINGQIRDLLEIFERSCYIGYTATPFANIFIDPDTSDDMLGQDLFPRSFIFSLDPPSNYFGAATVFLEYQSAYVRTIADNEDHLPLLHDKDIALTSVPPSLMDALRAFVIGKAIRLARGQTSTHNSMLVNASRFVNVQRQLRNEIHTKVEEIRASLRINGALPPAKAISDPHIRSLHKAWEKEYRDVEVSWSAVLAHLYEAVAPIRVVEVNGQSPGTLNYQEYTDDGLNVVAVGGYSLSRGLTLEGLMVSYFMRNSMMYDTLMQMGRWFGYRPGYQDLCRVWMPEEAQGWYEHISESTEALREEIRNMEAVGATPSEFGLKVRTHPDTLIVTARNKMGTSSRVIVNVGLANRFLETHTLRFDDGSIGANRAAAGRLVSRIKSRGHQPLFNREGGSGWLFREVQVKPIVEFLAAFKNHPGVPLTDGGPIRRFIEEREEDELALWDVFFPSIGTREDVLTDESLGVSIRCQKRSAGKRSDPRTLLIGNRQRVSTRGVEKAGLSKSQRATAERAYCDYLTKENRLDGKRPNFPDWTYRAHRGRPLLVVHVLDIRDDSGNRMTAEPVVAWSISFPPTNHEERHVEYVVNTTWMREHYGDELEEEEMLGDAR